MADRRAAASRHALPGTAIVHAVLLALLVALWAAIELFDVPIGAWARAQAQGGDLVYVAAILVVFMFAALAGGLWIGVALLVTGVVAMAFFTGRPIGTSLATTFWGSINSWALAALPLFIWMGEILFRSRLAEDMFAGLAPWMQRLPGRLMHVNVIGCGIFAAVSGSSAATAATIGKMSIPELMKRRYHEPMAIGSLAGAATLGLLIPPSIILIVYGVATEQSIARLFIAGVVPGIMLMLLFMGYIVLWALLNPGKTPPRDPKTTIGEKLASSRRLVPVLVVILGVIGSIYFGLASPTDAAAVGVILSLLLSWRSGTLTLASFRDGLMAAVRTSCMITFILMGAAFLTTAMAYTGIPARLAEWIGAMQLPPTALVAALTVLFIVLGCVLDGISIVVLTTAVIMPMVEKAGFDLVWFGIFLVVVVEMAQITPPVGFNLYVLQNLTGRDMVAISRASFPFFLVMVVAVILLVLWPEIATFLPDRMFRRGG
jgi:tripartite ATP-independent transporter DctM subunit